MRPKSIMLLLVALGCGLVASVGISQALKQPAPTEGGGATTPIFVAKAQIGVGDPLKPENLKLEEWPADKVPLGAITKLEDTEQRRSRTVIFPGEPIIDQKLLGKGEVREDASGLIPKGFRVVSIKVDSVSGAASLLKPGDRVDVLVHLSENPSRGITKTETVTFLQRIKIFALDDVFRRDAEGETTLTAKTVSLLVTPYQANLVTLASELGSLRLVMRGIEDDVNSETANATPGDIGKGIGEEGEEKKPDSTNPLIARISPPKQQPDVIEPLPPVETTPTPVAPPEPPKNIFKMLILEGDTRRNVEFQNGVLVHDDAASNNGAGGESSIGSGTVTNPETGTQTGSASATSGDSKQGEAKPSDDKNGAEKANDDKSGDGNSTDETSTGEKSKDGKSADDNSGDSQPADPTLPAVDPTNDGEPTEQPTEEPN